MNDSDRLEDVHTSHPGFDAGSWTIVINPVEEELAADGELFPSVAEE